ncbi:ATP-binding protein [Microvirga lenta]|uniref:ATP-binding protein n=1 Tax=Microvirga lenta TaxID=2881337 RepID=UPI001CFFBEDB|nr:ATP-binding protein [Microvirga lenta]MCB5175500.1 PAS domain S-box protein [Microvirga lenta]
MTDAQNQYEAMIARLAADPALTKLSEPGAGVLVWNPSADRLLWASRAAEGLRWAFADEAGNILPHMRAKERLKALAGGLAPREGARLERLRFDPARPWLPVQCACRLAEAGPGEPVLVTLILGPVPKGVEPPRPHIPAAVPESAEVRSEAPAEPSAPPPTPQGTIRFVWQADPQTRFTLVSPQLGEAVGPMAADIVGRSWDEVSRSVVEDPDGIVASLFARRETWSGRTILWTMDNSSGQVPVDWAGMPIFGEGRELVGFRGFGLLRMDSVREAARSLPTGQAGEEQAREPERSAPEASEGAQEAPVAEAPAEEEEGWFAHLRDRVAEALSNGKPEAEPQAEVAGEEAAPAVSQQPSLAQSSLSHAERNAFREIARALGARFEDDAPPAPSQKDEPAEAAVEAPAPSSAPPVPGDRLLDRLPIGILVHGEERILFANRFLLDLTGYEDAAQIVAAGGLERLFRGAPDILEQEEPEAPLALSKRDGETVAVDVRLSSAEWNGEAAQLMVVRKVPDADAGQRLRLVELDLQQRESRMHELESILDTATDGVIVLDETGRILSLNRSAEALFGYDQREVVGDAVTVLLSPESHIVALDYLEGLRSPGVASLLNDGREVLGRVRQGGTIPLFMTMGHVSEGPNRKFCAVLRDITAFKKAEGELVNAKRAAEEASAQKSDLLAKISHEIRTPLNAIIGFAEVMLEERFGPIGNERYKEYLKDVHASGAHVISLVNDLLDLAKVEAGRLELSFTSVNLNDLVSACFTLLQPQASRDRIVMRTSFATKLPPVVADERSVRQIVLNLVSNAIKFTDAGGQVIVSTAVTDRGEVAFRVRDTGIGMSETEVEAALEPFRQLATARKRGGTGLGLPLTKALVEANRGSLQISSQPNEGTLVEVIFPPTRVLAE